MNWFKRLFRPRTTQAQEGPPAQQIKETKSTATKESSGSSGAPVGLMCEILVSQMSPMEKERARLDPNTAPAMKAALLRDLRGRSSFFQ